MKQFAVFDIDGTIFRWQLYHELFDALVDERIITPEDAEAVLIAREEWRARDLSYDEYEQALIRVMEESIIGLDVAKFHAIADTILTKKGHNVYVYTSGLLKDLQKRGYTTVAISGSHQQLVERFCELHGIDIAVGRNYAIADGKIAKDTGTVANRKKAILHHVVKEHNLTWENSYAVGDAASDIAMLELVENPIAFNPNTELLAAAKKHGWPIVIERKSIAYQLEKGVDGTYVLAETVAK
jgi:HAD superfamily hydrolase (TIGR01490 family)